MATPTLQDLPAPPPDKTGWPWTEQSDPLPETQPDGSPWPKISIVTPSYNQGQFIEETIRSVLLQGYPDLEYIVMDGESTDESVEIIEKYEPWIDYWVSEEDEGQSDAINKGLDQATGELYAWLNSDDYYASGALWAVAEGFQNADPDVGALVGTAHKVDPTGKVIYTPDAEHLEFEDLLRWRENNFMQPGCFFRRSAWEEAGPLREDLYYCLDVDLWLRMAKKKRFKRIEQTLAYAYEHSNAKTAAHIPRMRAETALIVSEHGGYEVARQDLFEMANQLHFYNRLAQRITQNPLYRFLGPIYRQIRQWLLR